MNKYFITILAAFCCTLSSLAGNIDDVRQTLEQSSLSRVQEKVYIHTDNQCYFVGDTLWYKAYVVRADLLMPTDLSRILYVELLSPDGLLVERQQIVVNPKGYTCGQFALKDSLYSGYYELRAYTRWMLNFNVRHHRYSIHDTWWFYSKQMAADYFRIWDGLYSRVFPVYSKPDEAGDYSARRMYQRPKTRIPRQKKDDLVVNFYPEGGHLVKGVENRVAFEVTDQHGEAINIKGTVEASDASSVNIHTEHMGRGSFLVTPAEKRLQAHFTFRGKQYDVNLPKTEESGVAMQWDGARLSFQPNGIPTDKEYAVSVLCRGVLRHFEKVSLDGPVSVNLPVENLPSGVCDITLFDDEGRILSDRLFFVNNHEHDQAVITMPDMRPTRTLVPYERVEVPIQCEGVTVPTHISLSIYDTSTEEPTYNDGNIMTDLLLSSELRGFVAHPAYYFESDDDQHRRHLDLLMMVQGWRKYKWQELADTAHHLRYVPETTLTIEGDVFKMLGLNEVEPDEVANWQDGVGMLARKSANDETEQTDPFADTTDDGGLISTDDTPVDVSTDIETIEYGALGDANDHLGVNHGNLRHDVLVEAELAVGGQYVGSIQKTQKGHFRFQVPPFYGDAFLNMKAYKENDSIKKNMASRKDTKVLDEDAFPDYYVKRELVFPVFTHDYNFYEKHQPDFDDEMLIDTLSELSMENDVHQLGNVTVKGRRRGRRAIDWKKPAYVLDAYDLYNDMTDRGLSFGKLDMRQFPVQVCRYLYGNMNRYNSFRVDGRLDGATYYRNYNPVSEHASEVERAGIFRANRTPQAVYRNLKLKRLQDIRVFSDYEPRTEDSLMVESRYLADATVELVTIPDDGVQPTFRDRHMVFHGFNAAEDFYQPDYSEQQPVEPADYRRTLYWNPNAMTDDEGRLIVTFFNNSKETRIKMSAAGIASDGRLLHSK